MSTHIESIENSAYAHPIGSALNTFVKVVGLVVMWANLILIGTIFSQVALRYFFNQNYPKLDELQWHISVSYTHLTLPTIYSV